jgi:heterodisulfide reductase subunit B
MRGAITEVVPVREYTVKAHIKSVKTDLLMWQLSVCNTSRTMSRRKKSSFGWMNTSHHIADKSACDEEYIIGMVKLKLS